MAPELVHVGCRRSDQSVGCRAAAISMLPMLACQLVSHQRRLSSSPQASGHISFSRGGTSNGDASSGGASPGRAGRTARCSGGGRSGSSAAAPSNLGSSPHTGGGSSYSARGGACSSRTAQHRHSARGSGSSAAPLVCQGRPHSSEPLLHLKRAGSHLLSASPGVLQQQQQPRLRPAAATTSSNSSATVAAPAEDGGEAAPGGSNGSSPSRRQIRRQSRGSTTSRSGAEAGGANPAQQQAPPPTHQQQQQQVDNSAPPQPPARSRSRKSSSSGSLRGASPDAPSTADVADEDDLEAAPAADDDVCVAISRIGRFLNHRERCAAEVLAKLDAVGCEPALSARVLARLQAVGLQDDGRFAELFAYTSWKTRAHAAPRITYDLRARGVAQHHIDAALAAVFGDTREMPRRRSSADRDQHDAAWQQLVEACRRRAELSVGEAQQKRRAKLATWLQRRGHSLATAFQMFDELGM